MNAKNILWPQGRLNQAGTTVFYYAFTEDILTFPTTADPETATDFESIVEMTAAIVMKTAKQFFQMYCTLEEGEVKSNMVGARDSKCFENIAEISFPGNTAEFEGFKAAIANRQIVIIVKEKNGILRVIGSVEDPCYVETAEYTSGKKASDGRKTVMTFKDTKGTPPPIYTQAIASLLTPAT